ncbi:MFS transporter [Mammaliicoccus stepanovicii]|uniref:Alpha-ketoglutarate permease n=1 Tax=Mammaliicoccus stepanovicii TaxID=643214 RepID=A0A239YZL4_9STAP|nr:MFS transporter [Mammaliicoccus stepanovicii]PNZ78109.1 MFS transporter [Mammaliicoccus stepanovicii]GGI40361.1 putative transporter YoaB [Mammaliicoccus stepanovicii]SNV64621.1 alpha-ketoglutarate permease [Mammaliicoccus stepanovicii]
MNTNQTVLGMPKKIMWGYIGILIFMMGDGLEIGWLSPWLHEQGFSIKETSTLFASYGVTIAISSWFSGVLAESLGGKKTMAIGLFLYMLGTVCFVGFAIPSENLALMIPAYALRGFGYPLFAYSFLVWISYRAEKKHLGSAVGWFWFVFTGGLNVLGAVYSIFAIEVLGHVNTLWSSLFWVALGGVFALFVNRDTLPTNKGNSKEKVAELLKGITIMKDEPKVLLGGIVRIINTTAQFAFPVFLPIYLASFGIPTSKWLGVWSTIFISNIAFNLIFGIVGDKFGWRNTIMLFGGVGCGVTTLLIGYIPLWTDGNLIILTAVGILWGAFLAAYVPLSALVPSLVKKDKGAALAVLNLGAGLPVFIGPMIVNLFIDVVEARGVIWILAMLYFFSSILTYFIKLPNNAKTSL